MLLDQAMFGENGKVQKAIDRLKAFIPPDGHYLAFSGGKDVSVSISLLQKQTYNLKPIFT